MKNSKQKTDCSSVKTALTTLFIKIGKGSRKDGRRLFVESLGVSYQHSVNWINRGIPIDRVIKIVELYGQSHGITADVLARDKDDLSIINGYFDGAK